MSATMTITPVPEVVRPLVIGPGRFDIEFTGPNVTGRARATLTATAGGVASVEFELSPIERGEFGFPVERAVDPAADEEGGFRRAVHVAPVRVLDDGERLAFGGSLTLTRTEDGAFERNRTVGHLHRLRASGSVESASQFQYDAVISVLVAAADQIATVERVNDAAVRTAQAERDATQDALARAQRAADAAAEAWIAALARRTGVDLGRNA